MKMMQYCFYLLIYFFSVTSVGNFETQVTLVEHATVYDFTNFAHFQHLEVVVIFVNEHQLLNITCLTILKYPNVCLLLVTKNGDQKQHHAVSS